MTTTTLPAGTDGPALARPSGGVGASPAQGSSRQDRAEAGAAHFLPFKWRVLPGGHPMAEQVAFADRVADLAAGLQVLAQVFEGDTMADPDPVTFSPSQAGRLQRLSVTVLGMLASEARGMADRWACHAEPEGGAA